jgi:hypothetical protein
MFQRALGKLSLGDAVIGSILVDMQSTALASTLAWRGTLRTRWFFGAVCVSSVVSFAAMAIPIAGVCLRQSRTRSNPWEWKATLTVPRRSNCCSRLLNDAVPNISSGESCRPNNQSRPFGLIGASRSSFFSFRCRSTSGCRPESRLHQPDTVKAFDRGTLDVSPVPFWEYL